MSKYQLMTRDQEDLVEMVHAFMRKEVDPYVAEYDEKGICPIDTVRKLMDLGFWGIDVPGCDHHHVYPGSHGLS